MVEYNRVRNSFPPTRTKSLPILHNLIFMRMKLVQPCPRKVQNVHTTKVISEYNAHNSYYSEWKHILEVGNYQRTLSGSNTSWIMYNKDETRYTHQSMNNLRSA